MALVRVRTQPGVACPRCHKEVELSQLTDGEVHCQHCGGTYEARVFHPSARSTRVLQLAESGPEAAAACANHSRNTAVTTCERCGIFICALCELEVDGAKYCPACFERLAQEGAIHTARVRFRDYASLAGLSAVVGLIFSWLFLAVPLGSLGLFYAVKGLRTRRQTGVPAGGLVFALFASLLTIGFGVVVFLLVFWRKFK
jgi:uncharacterized paraquat-inducible protein A